MEATPFISRHRNDHPGLNVSYNADRQTFSVVFKGSNPQGECLRPIFTLNLKETSPEEEVKYTPWLISSPFPQAKFELPLAPYLLSPEICVAPASCTGDVPGSGKNTAQCVVRVHFTKSSGVKDFPYVGVGEPHDIAELVGYGPKMTAIRLYKRALDFHRSRKWQFMELATHLHRNKTKEYFGDIFLNHGGIMRPYLKDKTGDPKCPITNRLKGLFFSTTVMRSLLFRSPFGPHRFSVPLMTLLLNMGWWKLYFADFYCFDKDITAHHVNLVLCEKDTDAYKMCEECLLELPSENPFLMVTADQSKYLVNSHIIVEVIYTKEIDIVKMCRDMGAEMHEVPSYGCSDPRGIPKNPKCTHCNVASFEPWFTI